MRLWLWLVLASATLATAAIVAPRGVLDTCAAGCSALAAPTNYASSDGAVNGIFQVVATGTVNAKLQNSIDNGANWTDVTGATCTGCAPVTKWEICAMLGLYRIPITTCTGCTYTTSYTSAGRK